MLFRSRVERHNDGARNAEERASQSIDDRRRGMSGALTLCERLQVDENHGVIGCGTGEAKAGNGKDGGGFGLAIQDGFDLMTNVGSVIERGSSGGLDKDHDVALIFRGDEASRDFGEHPISGTGEEEKNDRGDEFPIE